MGKRLGIVMVAMTLLACGTNSSGKDTFNVDVNEPGNTDIYEPSDNRPTNATCVAPPRPPPPGFIALEPVFTDVLSPMDAFKLVELSKELVGWLVEWKLERGGKQRSLRHRR